MSRFGPYSNFRRQDAYIGFSRDGELRETDLDVAEVLGDEDGVARDELNSTIAALIDEVGGGMLHTQSVASASWVISHSFARVPNVAVYIAGELVETDVAATSTTVTITFPSPAAGVAVLN